MDIMAEMKKVPSWNQMSLTQLLDILSAAKRYIEFDNDNVSIVAIPKIEDNVVTISMCGYSGEKFDLRFYIDRSKELHIETELGTNVLEFSKEASWTKKDVEYIKYGRK